MGAPVFICYKREDKSRKFVEQLVKKLKARDIESWHDQKIRGSDEWRKEIDNAIEACAVVLVVVTPESMKSHYVTYEWSYAMGKDRIVLPLFLDGTNDILHPQLEPVQYREFRRQFEEEWDELIDDVISRVKNSNQISEKLESISEKLSNRQISLIQEFFDLVPFKLIKYLEYNNPTDIYTSLDIENGDFKSLIDRLVAIRHFSERPHLKTLPDTTLIDLLLDTCHKIIYLKHKGLDPDRINDEIFFDYKDMESSYQKTATYILNLYPQVNVP